MSIKSVEFGNNHDTVYERQLTFAKISSSPSSHHPKEES